MSYGVALLMTGSSDAAAEIALDIFRKIQPTLDRMLAHEVTVLYTGKWVASGGESEITVKTYDGSLWITKLMLNGTDVLRLTQGIPDGVAQKATPITLWSTGRHHEFRRVTDVFFLTLDSAGSNSSSVLCRMVFGAPDEFGAISYATCLRYWVSIDSGFARGYPMDLLYFTEGESGLVLQIPSADVTLARQ